MRVDSDWSAATFDGAQRAQRDDIARATPARRLAWLEEVLVLAQASGALARARREKQMWCEATWRATGDPGQPLPGP